MSEHPRGERRMWHGPDMPLRRERGQSVPEFRPSTRMNKWIVGRVPNTCYAAWAVYVEGWAKGDANAKV